MQVGDREAEALASRSHEPRSAARARDGTLAGLATTLSIAAIWKADGDGWLQAIAALWILAVLCIVLVPVIDHFGRSQPAGGGERVLAILGDVELVATHAGSLDPRLAPGERLLRRRP